MNEESNTNASCWCVLEICRSPLAAALLERALVERGIEGIAVASAGTGPGTAPQCTREPIWWGSSAARSLEPRARLLTRELVDGADLSSPGAHHSGTRGRAGRRGSRVCAGEYGGREGDDAEVSDPFGGDLDVYRTPASSSRRSSRRPWSVSSKSREWKVSASTRLLAVTAIRVAIRFPFDGKRRDPRPGSGRRADVRAGARPHQELHDRLAALAPWAGRGT